MSEDNTATVRRFVEAVQGRGELDAIDEYVADDFINHTAPPGIPAGPEGVRPTMELFLKAFPGMEVTIHEMVAEGDRVATRKTFRGVYAGDFMGIAPTGRVVAIEVVDILRLRDGKVTDHWGQADMLGALQQLGVLPTPGQAPS